MSRKKRQLEFRYYEIPHGEAVLALYGDNWIRPYGYDENDHPITNLHFHNLLEIGLCSSGKGEIILEAEHCPYEDGTVTVIPKNYPHTTTSEDRSPNKWEYLFIDVEESLKEIYPDNLRLVERMIYRINKNAHCILAGRDSRIAVLARQILREMELHSEWYRDSVRGLLRALLVEIARMNPESVKKGQPAECQKKTELVQIIPALEYVSDYFDREFRIGDLAAACHMSETHFRRLFVKCMGMHPVDYVNQIRIKMACELLKKTKLSVQEIAMKCGFCSSATFNRNFQRYRGMSPNKWKNLPENYERRLSDNTIAYFEGW